MEDMSKIIDCYMNDESKGFFSLYDGHGGSDPVTYAKNRMPEILEKFIASEESIEISLNKAFNKCDDELKFTDAENTGSTATIVFIQIEKGRKFLYSANVGDSKSVVITSESCQKLSYDHKCSDNNELDRIKSCGGFVVNERVFGQLALSRALGDHALKKYGVISTPFIKKIEIDNNYRWSIISSDGIWDFINEKDCYQYSKSVNNSEDFAKLLIKNAINLGSKDNISCIVIKF